MTLRDVRDELDAEEHDHKGNKKCLPFQEIFLQRAASNLNGMK